jgi:hypothetical protein
MDSAERQSVRRALDALKPYLEAFLAQHRVRVDTPVRGRPSAGPDIQALLKASVQNWDASLSAVLPRVARSYIHELLDVRNRWAHEEPFSAAEATRATDTARVFGALLGAPTTAAPAAKSPSKAKSGGRRESQRDAMIRIFIAAGRNPDRAVQEYAAAERRGEVVRKSNKHGIDPEAYARALLNDGQKKGWL